MQKIIVSKKDKWGDYYSNGEIGKTLFNENEVLTGGGNYVDVTGTIMTNTYQGSIRAGAKTIILTLSASTWATAGANFDAQRQNIINGIDSNKSEATGWDAVVKAGLAVTAVVRTSNTVVTITLPAFATYSITEQELITVTVPSTAVSSPVENTDNFVVYSGSRRLPKTYDEATYDSAGGKDYTSLATWEDATDTDLVTATKGKVLTCSSGIHNDTVTVAGATTNSSYFRVIRAASGQRGTPTSGVRFVKSTSDIGIMVIALAESYASVQDIAAKATTTNTGASAYAYSFRTDSENNLFVGCTAYESTSTASSTGDAEGFSIANSQNAKIINCVAIDIIGNSTTLSGGIRFRSNTSGPYTGYVYNSTIEGCSQNGLVVSTNLYGVVCNVYLKNSIVQGNTTNILQTGLGTENLYETTNATSGVTFDADGYHLASTDTGAINAGTDLSADGTFAFTDDIDGQTRDDWDIGADEYVNFVIANADSASSIENITLESGATEFVVADLASASSIENIALSQGGGTLAMDDLASASSIDNIVLEFNGGTLEIANEDCASSIENITLSQNGGTLEMADLDSASSIENIELTETRAFVIDNLDSASSIEEFGLMGTFEIGDIDSSSSIENIILEQNGGDFFIDAIDSLSSIENIDLEFNGGTFEIGDIDSASSIEEIELIGNFIISDLDSVSSIENIVLERNGGDFVIGDLDSSSSIENISIQQAGSFLVADIECVSSIENIDLSQNSGEFVIDDLSSSSSIENIALIGNFIIDDIDSLSSIDNVVLEFNGGSFAIDNSDSSSSIDQITLIQEGSFIIDGIECGSSIENITLERNGGDFIVGNLDSLSSIENIELNFNGGEFQIGNLDSTSTIENITLENAEVITYASNKPLLIDSIGGKVLQREGNKIPTWNTAGRPTGKTGLFGFNTETSNLEVYANSIWNIIN